MKVLVTGAAGFIGGQLMHALWKNGHTAIGVDNYSYGSADNLHVDDHDFSADVIKMDIRDKEGMKALFEQEKFDIVYNIAGIAPLPDCQSDPVEAVSVNTLGLVNVLENARRTGVKHVIQASTNAMYENADLSQHQRLRRAVLPELCRHLRHEHHLPALCQRLRPAH